jgi:predicted GNAT superfamily acetyltransferase
MTTAADALAAAGVTVSRLESLAAVQDAERLLGEVWRSPGRSPVPAELLRAIDHAGGYVFGAHQGEELVAVSAGFLGVSDGGDVRLHSHISGVLPAVQGRRLGWALKLHQREWSLDRGIKTVTWTFDPLIRRNAWFNLTKLGAVGVEYLADFYGQMHDGINAGDRTDRLFVCWELQSSSALAGVEGRSAAPAADGVVVLDERDGQPVVTAEPDHGPVLVRLPEDAESLRKEQPERALAWRLAVRAALQPLLEQGRQATGVTQDGCLRVEGKR